METFLLVGYIGLVLIVFEGGLTMQPSSFVPQLPLACVTALVGVLAPIALTFGLYHGYGYPTIDAFAAGSALASTSLGTVSACLLPLKVRPREADANCCRFQTFFVLRAAGPELGVSAVGEILKGAALIDDVIALVLLATIEPLASNGGDTSDLGWTVGRPIVASLAMAVVTPVAAVWIFAPIFRWRRLSGWVARGGHNAELFLGVAVLSAFLAIADYAGTTMLLGAFLAGYFLSALPAPGSAVSFVACWDAYLLPIHEHVSFSAPCPDTHIATETRRFLADTRAPVLHLYRLFHPVPPTLDRQAHLAGDRLRYPNDHRKAPRRFTRAHRRLDQESPDPRWLARAHGQAKRRGKWRHRSELETAAVDTEQYVCRESYIGQRRTARSDDRQSVPQRNSTRGGLCWNGARGARRDWRASALRTIFRASD